MEATKQSAIVEEVLARAADEIGDVTPVAIERFYQYLPAAKAAFEAHCHGNRPQLEGEMVARTLHCLMYWFESPGEVEIMLTGSVLHHHDTLHVTLDWYSGLIDATAAVIAATIPSENRAELATWQQLRNELLEVVAGCRGLVAHFDRLAHSSTPL